MEFLKKQKKGILLIYGSLILTTLLWLLTPGKIDTITTEPFTALNQITALLGTVLLSWAMILSIRAGFLEDWFGGLDKVYLWHKYAGEWGGALILLHPIGLALHNTSKALKWFIPTGRSLSVDLGVISFWLFVYLIVVTLLFRDLKIKYHIWRWLHIGLDIAFVLAFLHISWIGSDLILFTPLRLWIKLLTLTGVLAGLYKLLGYQFLAKHYTYKVKSVKKIHDTYDIRLEPEAEKIPYKPGQFSFVKFKSKNVSGEEHPFCMASAPEDKELRYVIKELGDFTKTLYKLRPGDKAVIYAPYGRIGEKYLADPSKDAVFVAGGVGIAPFLALLKTAPNTPNRNTYMYWCTRYAKDAVFNDELEEFAKKHKNVFYKNHKSREGDDHITAEHILRDIRAPKNTIFYLCAPVHMMKDLHQQLKNAGIPEENIVWEDFEMI